jgi:hypothetical protein
MAGKRTKKKAGKGTGIGQEMVMEKGKRCGEGRKEATKGQDMQPFQLD